MAPDAGHIHSVACENGFEDTLSADAMGITARRYTYNHPSFGKGDFAETFGRHYHLLREHILDHAEATAILGAID